MGGADAADARLFVFTAPLLGWTGIDGTVRCRTYVTEDHGCFLLNAMVKAGHG